MTENVISFETNILKLFIDVDFENFINSVLHFIRDITEGKPLPLEVTGIEYMNDDPAMVDVLYAKVSVKDGSDRFVFERKSVVSDLLFFFLKFCLNLFLSIGCR